MQIHSYDIILKIRKSSEPALIVSTVYDDWEKANILRNRLEEILQESSRTLYPADIKEHVVNYNNEGNVISNVCSDL